MEDISQYGALQLALNATVALFRFVSVAHEGLGIARHAKKAVSVVARARDGTNVLEPERLGWAEELEIFATQQTPDFPFLYRLCAFRLWAILEAAVDDLVREVLQERAELRELPVFTKIEGPLIEFAMSTPDEQAETLVGLVKQRCAASLKKGAGRFESLLGAVGLDGPVPDGARRVLLELSEVRNVVAHRDGKVDSRFISRCPWFAATKGEMLVVTGKDFDLYTGAVHWYLVELMRRIQVTYPTPLDESLYMTVTQLVETLADLEQRLEERLRVRKTPGA